MIPALINIGGPWKVLPPGIHPAEMDEVESRLATSNHRKHLFSGFKSGLLALSKAKSKIVFLDGSFITAKPIPNDYDVCWDVTGVDSKKLDPVFLDFSNKRKNQKAKYYGEFFPHHFTADGKNIFLDFFQIDKYTGKAKGIISINI